MNRNRNGLSLPKSARLRSSGDFARLAQDRSGPHLNRPWLSLSAALRSSPVPSNAVPAPQDPGGVPAQSVPVVIPARVSKVRSAPVVVTGVRSGFTVSRRNAGRAVARNMVKRVLREALRHSSIPDSPLAADLVLRLRRPLPGAADQGWASVKKELRRQADGLIGQFARVAG